MARPVSYAESLRPWYDPESGAKIVQLTSAACISTHIYPEAPIFSPDSRYFIFNRFASLDRPNQFWLGDTESLQLIRLTSGEMPVTAPVMAPDGGWLCYLSVQAPTDWTLERVDLSTFEREPVLQIRGYRRPYPLATISPDGRWYVTGVWLPEGDFGLLRVDLLLREAQIIHRDPEILNPHMQFDPGGGRDLLVQHNRGGQLDEAGNIVRLVGPEGATFYLVDMDGQNVRRLAIGKPYSAPVQGHQCWIGTTGRILSTLSGEIEAGNLVTIGEGDEAPTVVARGMDFCHPAASRDGRWFVSDVRPEGEIVVGSLETGRYRLLCRSGASFGRPQYTHPHPFFSPDRRRVFFNSDRTGLAQIYMAEIPESLWDELQG
ncbi:PD40 domain-containing protein [Litorilinea aerophila]|nr:PD40 domain-containing protein [Litorilinea aerophila]MCC9077011.1 PD40 domain-containing protein [Litorilinea aerophila]